MGRNKENKMEQAERQVNHKKEASQKRGQLVSCTGTVRLD